MPFALRFGHYDLAGIRLTALVIYIYITKKIDEQFIDNYILSFLG